MNICIPAKLHLIINKRMIYFTYWHWSRNKGWKRKHFVILFQYGNSLNEEGWE